MIMLNFLFTLVHLCFCDDVAIVGQQQDLSMLSCSESRNITFVIADADLKIVDTSLSLMINLIENEHCYSVNVYLNSEDRIVQLHKNDDFINHIEKSFGINELESRLGIENLTKRLYKRRIREK